MMTTQGMNQVGKIETITKANSVVIPHRCQPVTSHQRLMTDGTTSHKAPARGTMSSVAHLESGLTTTPREISSIATVIRPTIATVTTGLVTTTAEASPSDTIAGRTTGLQLQLVTMSLEAARERLHPVKPTKETLGNSVVVVTASPTLRTEETGANQSKLRRTGSLAVTTTQNDTSIRDIGPVTLLWLSGRTNSDEKFKFN